VPAMNTELFVRHAGIYRDKPQEGADHTHEHETSAD
jgi:hypothetical protein